MEKSKTEENGLDDTVNRWSFSLNELERKKCNNKSKEMLIIIIISNLSRVDYVDTVLTVSCTLPD